MKTADHPLIGRWRITASDLREDDYLDLVGEAALLVGADGRGEIAFGAMQAGLDIAYGPDEIGFTWAGFDEMDEVSGQGSAELRADGALRIRFKYHLGDTAILTAVRNASPAP